MGKLRLDNYFSVRWGEDLHESYPKRPEVVELVWTPVRDYVPTSERTALELSIHKWNWIATLLDGWTKVPFKVNYVYNGAGNTCALCMLCRSLEYDCDQCVISSCSETPYEAYCSAICYVDSPEAMRIYALDQARHEVTFLKSLRGEAWN